jgi:hypothetical protein
MLIKVASYNKRRYCSYYNNTSSSSVKDASWHETDGEVTLTGAAGMTLKNAINGFRIKDRYKLL